MNNAVDELIKLINDDKNFMIIDGKFLSCHSEIRCKNMYVVSGGEDSKTLAEAEKISLKMLEAGCNRRSVLVCVGGGVVGDLGGFVASIFMRGIDWVVAPTTLLAMVDSSIGGNPAVNLASYKNIVGAFHLPVARVVYYPFLDTLDEREWRCGLGEVVKTALLDDEIFDIVYDNLPALLSRDKIVFSVIDKCAQFKQSVVDEDFTEAGRRKILNLGHTLGHAFEKMENHRLSHGEYVLWGILAESFIFSDIIDKDCYAKICEMAKKVISSVLSPFDAKMLASVACHDKKNFDDKISVVVALSRGVTIEKTITADELTKKISGFYEGVSYDKKN